MWPLIVAGALAAGGAAANYMGQREDAERAAEAYDRIQGLAERAGAQNQHDIDTYRALVAGQYGNGAANYQQALANFLNSPVYQNDSFSYDRDVSDFMDPAMNQRVDAAMAALENAAASGGNRFSSDYMNRVGARQQAMASEEWEKAYNKLMQDRQSQMSQYTLNSNNAWNNYNAMQDRAMAGVNAYAGDRDAYVNGMGDALAAGVQNRAGVLNSQAQAISNTAAAQQGTSLWDLGGQLAGAGASFMGSYFGGK